MKTLKDGDIFKIIKEGGGAVGKSPLMPPWGAALPDQDIRNVVAYIRSLAK
jgi:mono/diheme cytochrome c family protein